MQDQQKRLTALYCRVSTSDQASGLESQIRTLTEHCQKQGLHNFLTFTDEGVSGAKTSRPGLDKMMAMVREGKVEKIIVYSFSRFARSVTHLLSALEEFRSRDISFLSYTEQVDTNSPMGRAFFVVIAAISQLERELIVERVKNGLKNARAKGVRIGRAKTRPSELIRSLLNSGVTLREAARIAKTSHGSVSLERKLMRQEAVELERTKAEAARTAQEVKLQAEINAAKVVPQFSTFFQPPT
ncbi:recombinase family protein [Bdellovibrionota bacterium FG-2]